METLGVCEIPWSVEQHFCVQKQSDGKSGKGYSPGGTTNRGFKAACEFCAPNAGRNKDSLEHNRRREQQTMGPVATKVRNKKVGGHIDRAAADPEAPHQTIGSRERIAICEDVEHVVSLHSSQDALAYHQLDLSRA